MNDDKKNVFPLVRASLTIGWLESALNGLAVRVSYMGAGSRGEMMLDGKIFEYCLRSRYFLVGIFNLSLGPRPLSVVWDRDNGCLLAPPTTLTAHVNELHPMYQFMKEKHC